MVIVLVSDSCGLVPSFSSIKVSIRCDFRNGKFLVRRGLERVMNCRTLKFPFNAFSNQTHLWQIMLL